MIQRTRFARRGFSLLEMLVVIVVLAVLTGITFTALRGARQAARGTVCQSNLRTLGVAFASYRSTYKDLLPLATAQMDFRAGRTEPFASLAPFLFALLPTVDADGQMTGGQPFACPADAKYFVDRGSSYVYQPVDAMASIVASHGPEQGARIYVRLLADQPDEELLSDILYIHSGSRNVLLGGGNVVSK